MPKCKNDPKRSYKGTEPSPKGLGYCAHSEKIGEIKKGRDNNLWIVKEYKKSKKWIKYKRADKGVGKRKDKTKRKTSNKPGTIDKTIEKLLNKKLISENDENYITDLFKNNRDLHKEYFYKFIKQIITIKTKEYTLNINKYLELYDDMKQEKTYNLNLDTSDNTVKLKLDKGEYIVSVPKYIKNVSSMIIIKTSQKINYQDVKFTKYKDILQIDDFQNIVFKEIEPLLEIELIGRQFFGSYNIYLGKINNKIKLVVIPLLNFINDFYIDNI